MDSRHYSQSFQVAYAQDVRPEYPTPPPSFSNHPATPVELVQYGTYISANSTGYIQIPTPQESASILDEPALGTMSLNNDEESDTIISISTAFHPHATPSPDTLLSSSDGVIFYVNAQTVHDTCSTAFQRPLSAPLSDPKFRDQIIHLDIPSKELNIILHTLYGISPAAHSPDLKTLIAAVDRMPSYSITPKTYVVPTSPLFTLLLSQAPLHPMDVYALAAHHNLHELAVSTSSHLLSYDVTTMSDDVAVRVGPIYLKKLMLLHAGRFSALKAILLRPPHPHPATRQCSFEDQRKLTRAWALTSAYFAWESRPDLSTHVMRNALNPLMEHITCELCHQTLQGRIKEVVSQWASVTSTSRGYETLT